MRFGQWPMPPELAILSAEQYAGTAGIHLSRKAGEVNLKSPPSHSDDGPRKRVKTSARTSATKEVDEDVIEQRTRRSRGRPRLDGADSNDQTAADRRRTQIRLAQRAYRSRKENAIQSLEKQVQTLQETNEDMSNAFMQLHDYAVKHGVLDVAPDFARVLRATTKKFISLARSSGDDGTESQPGSPDKATASSSERLSSSEKSSSHREGRSGSPSSPEVINTVLGYQVSMEAAMPSPVMVSDAPDFSSFLPTTAAESFDHQARTTPTHDAIDPPLSISDDPTFADPFGAYAHQSLTGLPSPSLLSPLPLSKTLSFAEATFGRRLHRCALETGYRLLTMPNPPKERLAQVYGFCLLFEPIDKIRERLRIGLAKTSAESLSYWQAPFWALGGSGQHQFSPPAARNGTTDKHTSPKFGLGPFGAKVTAARDRLDVDARSGSSMRMTLPGFEGDFFDADDVESYLASRGVAIQPGHDFATAEVDDDNDDGGGCPHHDLGLDYYSAAFLGSSSSSSSSKPGARSNNNNNTTARSSGWAFGDDGLLDNTSGVLLADAAHPRRVAPPVAARRKRLVTVDVNILIKEIVSRGVCLGRSPGFRPADVNTAFRKATMLSGDDGTSSFGF